MVIRQKNPSAPRPSEITPRSVFMDRRRFLRAAAAAGAAAVPLLVGAARPGLAEPIPAKPREKLQGVIKSRYTVNEPQTAYEDITRYNNFYEFGTGKGDPARNAHSLRTRPWSVAVEGEVDKPGVYAFEDLIKPNKLEERVYRLRCVEAWSMVVPWVGVPLGDVIKRLGPTSKAKFVAFETLYAPEQMPGQRRRILDWPYTEGLRMDEAMHPLSLLAVGLYGEVLPNQNGAPIRLVVPWKYGFKSIKSIVKIRFQETQPPTTWNLAAPSEYGFYSNVNPKVDHPRWSQAKERRIGDSFFAAKRPTLMFNGYADEVAGLYAGMDLAKFY